MRRSRIVLGVGVVIAAAVWWHSGQDTADGDEDGDDATAVDRGNSGGSRRTGKIDVRSGAIGSQHVDGAVAISGRVIERDGGAGVGGVEVVFRSEAGEESTTAGADGSYRIELAAGTYRAFVRDDAVLMVGHPTRVRLPSAPDADSIGAPDETAMPIVIATRDQEHVDLPVVRGGTIIGHVRDRAGRPIAHAVVRANGSPRPVLGSDVIESDDQGAFSLRVPFGSWTLDATHPRYAGLVRSVSTYVAAGDHDDVDLTLIAGCVISGKVLGATGLPANEGAIEKKLDPDAGYTQEFTPMGKILADGTFRWVTTETTDITLRAWPWKSPPSPAQTFTCADGARFNNVVFQLPAKGADIDGTLADSDGAPVGLAYIDLVPLDPGGIGQQERTDSQGHWGVFSMPAGRYKVTAYAQGKGVVTTTVTSPQHGVALELSGVGSIAGNAPTIKNGSFELQLVGCGDLPIVGDTRIVGVVDGAFSVEDLPACDLRANAVWSGRTERVAVHISRGGIGSANLAFAPEPEPAPDEYIVDPRPPPEDPMIEDPDPPSRDNDDYEDSYDRDRRDGIPDDEEERPLTEDELTRS